MYRLQPLVHGQDCRIDVKLEIDQEPSDFDSSIPPSTKFDDPSSVLTGAPPHDVSCFVCAFSIVDDEFFVCSPLVAPISPGQALAKDQQLAFFTKGVNIVPVVVHNRYSGAADGSSKNGWSELATLGTPWYNTTQSCASRFSWSVCDPYWPLQNTPRLQEPFRGRLAAEHYPVEARVIVRQRGRLQSLENGWCGNKDAAPVSLLLQIRLVGHDDGSSVAEGAEQCSHAC
ncbi:hypothetical protein IWX90DRAFT_324261 [Phyllosticta citrichinensis]|uniref:Uncharacterized protein n=1 Tax=Phyllosticta citrichinensis TaxID=1130410 RepID=A0ABR1XJX4_9PEZI